LVLMVIDMTGLLFRLKRIRLLRPPGLPDAGVAVGLLQPASPSNRTTSPLREPLLALSERVNSNLRGFPSLFC
jgi:hypothetical protein